MQMARLAVAWTLLMVHLPCMSTAQGYLCQDESRFSLSFCRNNANSEEVQGFHVLDAQHGSWPLDQFCQAISSAPGQPDDYDLSVDVYPFKMLTYTNQGHVGIIFNVQDPLNYDYVFFRAGYSTHCYNSGYMLNGVNYQVSCGNCANGPPKGRTWFNIKLLVRLYEAYVYIDGKLAITYSMYWQAWRRGGVLTINGHSNQAYFQSYSITKSSGSEGCLEIPLIDGPEERVPDSQITCSSYYGSNECKRSRWSSGSHWRPYSIANSWIQVSFGKPMSVSAVATVCAGYQVRSYVLMYSGDGGNWTTYGVGGTEKVFTGNTQVNIVVKHYLEEPFAATYVRLSTRSYSHGTRYRPQLRWELYGCKGSTCLPNPCWHDGECFNVVKDGIMRPHCNCQPGWEGDRCEILNLCIPNPCLNGAVCEKDGSGFRCVCPEGYEGERCGCRNPCLPNPCLHGSECVRDEEENFHCVCSTGYEGTRCERPKEASLPLEASNCMPSTGWVNETLYVDGSQGSGFCRVQLPLFLPSNTTAYEFRATLYNIPHSAQHTGVMYNVVDENNYDFIYFRPNSTDQCYQTGFMLNGAVSVDTDTPSSACRDAVQEQDWFTVSVKVIGSNSIQVTQDGHSVLSVNPRFGIKPAVGLTMENGHGFKMYGRSFDLKEI